MSNISPISQIIHDCQINELRRIVWFLQEHERCIIHIDFNAPREEWNRKIEDAMMLHFPYNTIYYITRIKDIVRTNPNTIDYSNVRFVLDDDQDMHGIYSTIEEGEDVTGLYYDVYEGQDIPSGQSAAARQSPRQPRQIIDEEATDSTRGLECKICNVNKICVALFKCGHTFCYSCTRRFNHKCATCRTHFADDSIVHIYI